MRPLRQCICPLFMRAAPGDYNALGAVLRARRSRPEAARRKRPNERRARARVFARPAAHVGARARARVMRSAASAVFSGRRSRRNCPSERATRAKV